jgi:hypothetical protein
MLFYTLRGGLVFLGLQGGYLFRVRRRHSQPYPLEVEVPSCLALAPYLPHRRSGCQGRGRTTACGSHTVQLLASIRSRGGNQ